MITSMAAFAALKGIGRWLKENWRLWLILGVIAAAIYSLHLWGKAEYKRGVAEQAIVTAAVQSKFDDYRDDAIESAKREEDARKLREAQLQQETEEITHGLQNKLAATERNRANLAVTNERLRNAAKTYAASGGAANADSAITEGGAARPAAGMVLANMLGSCATTAADLAIRLDTSHAKGLACEAHHDAAVRATQPATFSGAMGQ